MRTPEPSSPISSAEFAVNLGRGRLGFVLAKLRHTAGAFRAGWGIFMESRVGALSLFTIVVFALMALSHPILMATVWDPATYHPVTGYALGQVEQPAPPSWSHLLGTDPLGRDVLSQLLYSTRSEFVLGITAALVTVGIATLVGAAAAYYGGLLDAFFMRLADLIIALPAISLLIVLSALFNLNLFYLALIIGVLGGFGGYRHNPQGPGPDHPRQAVHRSGARRGRRPSPHRIRAHHPAPATPVPPLHDVHRHPPPSSLKLCSPSWDFWTSG